MISYLFDIGERGRKVARFVGHVRAELQKALAAEKKSRKLTQQQIATAIGTNRSVINREIMGYENLTVRRVAELAWALGWEIDFKLRKPDTTPQVLTLPTPIRSLQQSLQLQATSSDWSVLQDGIQSPDPVQPVQKAIVG